MKPTKYLKFFPGKSNNAHLILFDNEKAYIVKFFKKGQEKILFNEWLGYALARYMGLPIPPSRFVEIPPDFLATIEEKEDIIYTSKQFATQFIPNCLNAHELEQPNIVNQDQLAGIITLDYWLYNTDRTRKNVLFKHVENGHYLYMIDLADSFGSFAWKLEDLQMIDQQNLLKSATHQIMASFIKNKEEFEKQLHIIEAIPSLLLREIVEFTPDDWNITKEEKEAIIEFLIFRRDKILPQLLKRFIKLHF